MDDNKVVNLRSRAPLKAQQRLAKRLWLMPKNVRDSLTEQQPSLKVAQTAISWRKYALAIATAVALWSYRYYSVLVAGRGQRERTEQEIRVKQLMYFLVCSLFLLPSLLLGILLLYLVKSAIGIDIFPGFSFGVWSWFKEYI